MGIGEFALGLVIELLGAAMEGGVNLATIPYFQQRKIKRRVEDATAEVVEPLIPFLTQEHVPEDKQRRLIQTCVDELRPLTNQPERLFQGSLDGQKIFEDMYAARELPQVIIEDGLKDVYALLFPRIATLLCKIPAAVKDWESEAWSENFRRFDELVAQLRSIFIMVDELASQPLKAADESLTAVRRTLAQKIGFELDLTGLRADRPLVGKFDDFFVHPELAKGHKLSEVEGKIGSPEEVYTKFTARNYRAIVVGPPGAGKSTWSKWLQREALTSRRDIIAVRVELRRFSGEDLMSLHALIREAAGRHLAEELTAEHISRWVDHKRVILILDGFDEIRPSDRDKIYEWIVDLEVAARDCPIVITSRPLTTKHLKQLGRRFYTWTMEPFELSRIIDYIERWYRFTPVLEGGREVDATSLARQWGDDPTLGPLTGNPLLLSTLLMVHHLDGSLPGGRSQLYRRYVQGMLGLWDDRRQVAAASVQMTLEQKRQILRGFALYLFLREEEQIDETDTLDWLQEILRRMNISSPAEDVLAVLRERSGLITGPGIYGFAHKSIGEYMVAETILEGDQRDQKGLRMDRFRLFENRDDDRWNTVTFLWAGLAPIADVEEFISECVQAGSWNLGGGILFDLYERIPMSLRRDLVLQLFSSEHWPASWDNDSYLFVPGPVDEKSGSGLPRPEYILRSLSPNVTAASLLEKALSDGTLTWADSGVVAEGIRDLIWIRLVDQPDFLDSKLYLMAPPCPSRGAPSLWRLWGLLNILNKALKDPSRFEGVVGNCKDAESYFRRNLPIALLTLGLDMKRFGVPQESLVPVLSNILKVLPFSYNLTGEVPELLKGTRKWLFDTGASASEKPFDLLRAFTEQMKLFVLRNRFDEQDAIFIDARTYVEKLIALRENL